MLSGEGDLVMNIRVVIKRSFYFDSFSLMKISSEVRKIAGVQEAMVCMGTDLNKEFLRASKLLTPEAEAATVNDLIIALNGEDEQSAAKGANKAEELLQQRGGMRSGGKSFWPRSLENAQRRFPEANLVLISIPGRYVRREAEFALNKGLHVMIFSDNVPIEDEVELKRLGQNKGLFVMGPDCGTAIINGTPLGFANAVRRGPVGIIGASGTGIQELSVILHKIGIGVGQAIGTGGRDLSREVGGITTRMAIDALAGDPEVQIIVLLAKGFDKETGADVLTLLKRSGKPTLVNLMGWSTELIEAAGLEAGLTLEDTAFRTAAKLKREMNKGFLPTQDELALTITSEATALSSPQKYLRGLFSGGSLCAETVAVFSQMMGKVYSNIHHVGAELLSDLERSIEHTVIDLGDDYFTRGRVHPMIDPRIRIERLLKEAEDREVGVILIDIILGFGSAPDMAGSLLPAIVEAKRIFKSRGGYLSVVVNLCGTEEDPQNLEEQKKKLLEAGVVVVPTNALAARVAAGILMQRTQT
jgi:FdrA protein